MWTNAGTPAHSHAHTRKDTGSAPILHLPTYRYDPKRMVTKCLLLSPVHGHYGSPGFKNRVKMMLKGLQLCCPEKGRASTGLFWILKPMSR